MGTVTASESRRSRKARTVPFQRTYDTIIGRLVQARKDAGLSQRDVCESLGFSHSFLSKCETGERRIDVIELLQLAKVYGKPPSHFLED